MPTIDSARAQILLVEMQPEIVASVRTIAQETLLRAVTVLRAACDSLAIPVHATIVPLGPAAPTLVEELDGLEPVLRNTVSAFDDTGLRDRIHGLGRRVLAIGGVSSEIAIVNCGLAAIAAGYEVHLLVDACGGLDPRTESAAFRQLENAGARPSSVSSFLTGMIGGMDTDAGKSVMAGMARLWQWDGAA